MPPTKGLSITMYPRAGVPSLPSFCPWVTGYNTSHSEHPSDVLLIATAPTLAQLVFIVSLGLLLLSPQTCDLPLCLLDGFRAIFMNFMSFHFSVCIYMTCPLCIRIRFFSLRSHFTVQCLRPRSVSLIPLLSSSPASHHL